jgi:hypothetical protein
MSNHPIEQDELMAYLDGELEARRAAEAASHLKQCAECQKLAADLQEVSQMLVSWQVEEGEIAIPDKMATELEAPKRLKQERVAGNWWTYLRHPSGRQLASVGGTALVLLLILAISIPNLLRSGKSAEESARLARERNTDVTKPQESRGIVSGYVTPADSISGAKSPASPRKTMAPQPTATPMPEGEEEVDQEDQETSENPPGNAPMIIRTADLGVVVKEFEKARSSVEEILKRHHGHVGELNVNNPTGAARSLSGTLRIPSNQLDATLNELKVLGRVDKESQGGEEVTQQYVDLQARLANAKHTEQRLIEIQATRTGKLSDVLAVEMQIGRVRGEIERMEAERKNMKNQVDFATLNLTVVEDYKADLKVGPPSTGTQFRNAAVDGLESVTHGIISLLLWLLSVGPTLLLWVAILFFPVRFAWRKLRPRLTPSK